MERVQTEKRRIIKCKIPTKSSDARNWKQSKEEEERKKERERESGSFAKSSLLGLDRLTLAGVEGGEGLSMFCL